MAPEEERSRSRSRGRGRDREERPRSPRRESRAQRRDRDGYERPRSRSPRPRHSRSYSRYPRNVRRDGGGRRPSPNRHNRTGAPGAVLDSKQVQGAQPSMGEKALEERLAEMEKKMELKFKADCEAAVAKAYQDGRKQAEEALTSYRLPYRGRISPIKYFAHLMEIIYGYYFIGGHKSATLLKKMMDYWRLLLALYEIFTFESLVKADEYVRSREEAQGNPKTLTWAIDQTTRYRLLREYQPGTFS